LITEYRGQDEELLLQMVNNTVSTGISQSLGTAAIIGLSLAFVLQWLSAPSADDDENDVDNNDDYLIERKLNDKTSTSTSKWWWPITIMMKRRKKKRRKRTNSGGGNNRHDDDDNNIDNIANNHRNLDDDIKSYGYCDHLGSCDCGSIQFIVSSLYSLCVFNSDIK